MLHPARNALFDRLRLVLAASVLLSHAPEILDGDAHRELMHRATGTLTFGAFAVDGFFLLSGYLIAMSWERSPQPGRFGLHRMRRIVPGYLVAALLSIGVLGLLFPAKPGFFHHLGLRTLGTLLLLSAPATPPVTPGLPYHLVNGSLWTIAYEARCYALLALLGVAGVQRRPQLLLAATLLCAVPWLVPAVQHRIAWHSLLLLTGDPAQVFRLNAIFLIGACFYLFRAQVSCRPGYAALAAALMLACCRMPLLAEPVLVLAGGYLIFYTAKKPLHLLAWPGRIPDISYGIYLYGWPVEVVWASLAPHGSPWVLFAGSLAVCVVLGWLSWRLVEEPFVHRRPKRKPPQQVTPVEVSLRRAT